MPGRSGVSLLNRIRNERPDIVRMLTTAYADLDSAIDAVNKGEILRYISKPWDLRVLEAEIEQAITFYLLKNEYDLLLRDKLSALHRTLLRDRMNGMAFMSGMLPYNNAPLTMYNYLKMLSQSQRGVQQFSSSGRSCACRIIGAFPSMKRSA